jgi:hypothetical protein
MKKLKLEGLKGSGNELCNVASIAACWQIHVAFVLHFMHFFLFCIILFL